jgi:hypothetical protein
MTDLVIVTAGMVLSPARRQVPLTRSEVAYYRGLRYAAARRVFYKRKAKNQMERTEWNTEQLQEDFTVIGFLAPYVVVKRKSDGQKGTLEFTHSPRVYFGWQNDEA